MIYSELAGIRSTAGGDSTSKNKTKIWYNIFLSETRFSRKSTLKFVHLCERFSCLFFYRGCLRPRQCLQTSFIAWLKQYKVFLLIINFLFLITTFCCNTTIQCTVSSTVENRPPRCCIHKFARRINDIRTERKLISFFHFSYSSILLRTCNI